MAAATPFGVDMDALRGEQAAHGTGSAAGRR